MNDTRVEKFDAGPSGASRRCVRASIGLLAALLLAMVTWPGSAQLAGERPPLQVEVIADLDFGRLVALQHGGQVKLDPGSQSRRALGNEEIGSDFQLAVIRLRGVAGASFRVLLPHQVEMVGPRGRVLVRDLKLSPGEIGTLGPDGRSELRLGGAAVIGGAVRGGPYSATFEIQAEYL